MSLSAWSHPLQLWLNYLQFPVLGLFFLALIVFLHLLGGVYTLPLQFSVREREPTCIEMQYDESEIKLSIGSKVFGMSIWSVSFQTYEEACFP